MNLDCLTSLQVSNLGSFRSTSVDAGGLQAGGSSVLCSDLLHLLSQLTRGGQHQALNEWIREQRLGTKQHNLPR